MILKELTTCVFAALQLCGSPDGLHEEQNPGQVLQGSSGQSEALPPSGFLPPEAGPAHPQIPPVAPGIERPVTPNSPDLLCVFACFHLCSVSCHVLL